MNISKETMKILAPLSEHRSQSNGGQKTVPADPKLWRIGGGWCNDPDHPTISHDVFVANVVLPALKGACDRYGQQKVAADIVDLALRLYPGERNYRKTKPYWPSDETASFLSTTLRGYHESDMQGEIDSLDNPRLATKYGIKTVFEPIVDLGLTHQKTRFFDEGQKFFHNHACSMGEIIDNFGLDGYRDFIETSKKLLENGLYDWSISHSPEQWAMFRPSVRKYGLKAVLEPMIDAMIAVRDCPGTIELKYKYSLLLHMFQVLNPLMVPRIRKRGPEAVTELLKPLVRFIHEAHKKGAFVSRLAYCQTIEGKFFRELIEKNEVDIGHHGMQYVLKKVGPEWIKQIIKHQRMPGKNGD